MMVSLSFAIVGWQILAMSILTGCGLVIGAVSALLILNGVARLADKFHRNPKRP